VKVTKKKTRSFPRSFDHGAVLDPMWPEYQQVHKAMNKLALRLDDEGVVGDRDDFADLMLDVALSLWSADCCERCAALTDLTDDDGLLRMVWPHRAEVNGIDFQGSYRCPQCGFSWQCYWNTSGWAKRRYVTTDSDGEPVAYGPRQS
jgi:hypothetical protein